VRTSPASILWRSRPPVHPPQLATAQYAPTVVRQALPPARWRKNRDAVSSQASHSSALAPPLRIDAARRCGPSGQWQLEMYWNKHSLVQAIAPRDIPMCADKSNFARS
jgi:hypothetical protein